MDEKRFTVDGLSIAENSPKGRKYLLEYQRGVNALCSRINGLFDKSERLEKENEQLKGENKELQEFKDKVFNSIDKTIESETQIAENIESTIEGDYVKAVNRLTIIAFKNLKKELSE